MDNVNDLAFTVELPRLRAGGLVALTRSLIAAATDPDTDTPLAALRTETAGFVQDLTAAQLELQATLGPAATATDTPETRQADRREDNAIIALRAFLEARGRLDDAGAVEARTLLDRLFGQDTRAVTTLPYEEEWAAVEAKLERVATDAKKPPEQSERLRERLAAVGGEAFWTHLERVHSEYGRALGITVVRQEAESQPVQDKKRALEGLLREYIVHVSGLTTRRAPAEQKALAAKLLAPYVDAKEESKAARPRQTKPNSEGKPAPGTSAP